MLSTVCERIEKVGFYLVSIFMRKWMLPAEAHAVFSQIKDESYL